MNVNVTASIITLVEGEARMPAEIIPQKEEPYNDLEWRSLGSPLPSSSSSRRLVGSTAPTETADYRMSDNHDVIESSGKLLVPRYVLHFCLPYSSLF